MRAASRSCHGSGKLVAWVRASGRLPGVRSCLTYLVRATCTQLTNGCSSRRGRPAASWASWPTMLAKSTVEKGQDEEHPHEDHRHPQGPAQATRPQTSHHQGSPRMKTHKSRRHGAAAPHEPRATQLMGQRSPGPSTPEIRARERIQGSARPHSSVSRMAHPSGQAASCRNSVKTSSKSAPGLPPASPARP